MRWSIKLTRNELIKQTTQTKHHHQTKRDQVIARAKLTKQIYQTKSSKQSEQNRSTWAN